MHLALSWKRAPPEDVVAVGVRRVEPYIQMHTPFIKPYCLMDLYPRGLISVPLRVRPREGQNPLPRQSYLRHPRSSV